jgi:hypothetical protein
MVFNLSCSLFLRSLIIIARDEADFLSSLTSSSKESIIVEGSLSLGYCYNLVYRHYIEG